VYYRRAVELKPDLTEAQSNLLFSLQYCTGVTLAALAEAHAMFDQVCPLPNQFASNAQNECADRRQHLRIGFLSPDLVWHPVSSFFVCAFAHLDRGLLETFCYSDRATQDGVSQRLKAAAYMWRDVHGMGDERIAELIRKDEIDILFDLAGHTARNRLRVFAHKPAPIQITWIGYEGTTGLSAMDYLLADRYVVPEGTEPFYCERILRMPDGYVCYNPPANAPPAGPPPSLKNGFVTFGSFNNPAKITSQVVSVWAKILQRVPRAQLVLKYRGFGDAAVQQRYRELFAVHGVDAERVQFQARSTFGEYLAAYQQIDVALDPFPFNGGATTCEALWMGVPVITCPGETFASRHSLSHLSNIGLTETIACDVDDYVEIAVALANNPHRLAEIRSALRDQMAISPLCDGPRFAQKLTALLIDTWNQRVAESS